MSGFPKSPNDANDVSNAVLAVSIKDKASFQLQLQHLQTLGLPKYVFLQLGDSSPSLIPFMICFIRVPIANGMYVLFDRQILWLMRIWHVIQYC